MKVLITGGTGTLGSAFVGAARGKVDSIRILSRRPQPDDAGRGIAWSEGNISTGDGIDDAVNGVNVVVHAATSPGRRSKGVDAGGTKRMLKAAEKAGVDLFLYPSIVGIEDIPFSYYRHKLLAEQAIKEADVPHAILRATQFHSLVHQLIAAAMRFPLITFLPTDFQAQPVDSREVANQIVEHLQAGDTGRLPEFGGPEISTLRYFSDQWMELKQKSKSIFRLPFPGEVARAFRNGKNITPENRKGIVTWKEWLQRKEGEAV